MKPLFAGVALAALAAAATGCGGHSTATRLKIEVSDRSSTRAYHLRCEPAGGSAPEPAAICRALRREPRLLVGGPALDHSCPGGNYEAFRVSGTYRGFPVEAVVPPQSCAWVPGQDGAGAEWSSLMDDAGPGVSEKQFGKPQLTRPQRVQRRAQRARAERLARHARKLVGDWNAGRRDERIPFRVFREQLEAQELAGRPRVARAVVYRTTQRVVERVLGFAEPIQDRPMYLLVVRYAYRDYRGRIRLADDGATWALYDRRTLRPTGGGLGHLDPRKLRALGAPAALSL